MNHRLQLRIILGIFWICLSVNPSPAYAEDQHEQVSSQRRHRQKYFDRLSRKFDRLAQDIHRTMRKEKNSVLELKKIERALIPLEEQIDDVRALYTQQQEEYEAQIRQGQDIRDRLDMLKAAWKKSVAQVIILKSGMAHLDTDARLHHQKIVEIEERKAIELERAFAQVYKGYLSEERKISFEQAHLMDIRGSLNLLQREEELLESLLLKRRELLSDLSVQKKLGVKEIRRLAARKKNVWAKIQTDTSELDEKPKLGIRLIHPVSSKMIRRFGDVLHSQTETSRGIVYDAPLGTDVRAAGSGKVAFVGHMRGYGRMIIIDHGRRYFSLYAHLSSISVEQGKRIVQGTSIGKSGASESSQGPRLYFELRSDGKPIDPGSVLH